MKTTGRRSLFLFAFLLLFVGGLSFFLYEYVTQGATWAMQPYNAHLSGTTTLADGSVKDRNGAVLMQTKDGKRSYHEDAALRKSTLHVLGDEAGYISTGVQHVFQSQLSGYNIVTGLADLKSNKQGGDVQLSIDASLNKLAYQQFDGRQGAAIVSNWKTGEILCMVSLPTFDPAKPPADLKSNEGKYEGVYLNKALSGQFVPGSIFKVVTAAAAIENLPNLDSMRFQCKGTATVGNKRVTCTEAHGNEDFTEALQKSCNIAFAQIAVQLGKDKMQQTADRLGVNDSFSVDGIRTGKGNYNNSQADTNALGWSGVGQYTDLVNPAYMVRLMGAIANGGTPMELRFVQGVSGDLLAAGKYGTQKRGAALLSVDTAAKLKSNLRSVVSDYYGDDMFPGIRQVCAKTGTAELGKDKDGKDLGNNGWIVGFSTDERTPYAFAVVVEHTNTYGSRSAGPIAAKLLQAAAKG